MIFQDFIVAFSAQSIAAAELYILITNISWSSDFIIPVYS